MCRLLGFATAGSNTNLNGVLGMQNVRDFRNLSEIHNDGWGAALITVPDESPYRRDGGAPTPETGTAIYKNTIAARHDPIFDELANTPARGGLWHLRLASSNLPLILENQQPFYANGLSFIHNGDISDDQGRNIITNRAFPVDPSIVQSTGAVPIPPFSSPSSCNTSALASHSTRPWRRPCANCAKAIRSPATTA